MVVGLQAIKSFPLLEWANGFDAPIIRYGGIQSGLKKGDEMREKKSFLKWVH